MFTFGEYKLKVATLVQRSQDATYITKIGDWINFAQDFAYRAYDYYAELESKFDFVTVASQESYYMPSLFGIPLRIYDFTSNNKIRMLTEESYTDVNIASISGVKTGQPEVVRLFGISPVCKKITSAITLKAKSSSLLDTSSIIVRIEGFVDSNKSLLGYDYITINSAIPTTYESSAGSVSFYEITKINKSADTIGYISIADQSGNLISTIMPNDRGARFPVINLGLIPDKAYNMRVHYKRMPNRMVNDYDYPFIDADEFFINYAFAYCLNEEKENVSRIPMVTEKATSCLSAVIRNQQSRMGEDFQHKIAHKMAQAFRV
jgi:hypothetical protein